MLTPEHAGARSQALDIAWFFILSRTSSEAYHWYGIRVKIVPSINDDDREFSLAASIDSRYPLRVNNLKGLSVMDDAELVRHQYHYDPETGEWLWRNPPFKAALSKASPGMPAGSIDVRDGTRHLKLGKKICRASRLAWLYEHGEWPVGQVL